MKMTNGKKSTAELVIALDFGGSLTKMIASSVKHHCRSECMEPYVIEVSGDSIREYEKQKLGSTHSMNRAWVEVGQKYYAVGYLAQSRFLASSRLSQLKYEQAVYKSLVAIWVFQHQWQLSRKLKVALACLLPPGEWKDSQKFKELLIRYASSFVTPDGLLEVEITDFNCKPEGAGVFMMHRAKRGELHLQRLVTAVVMLGYRNASLMLCRRGEVGEFITSPLGFISLVKGVIRRTSGYQEEPLARAIALAGEDYKEQPLQKVLRSSSQSTQQEELVLLRESIQQARGEYVASLRHWLSEQIPKEVEEVIVCGGTADYLYGELQQHWQHLQIFWHAEIKIPEQLSTLKVGNRLADVWSLFCYFCEQIGVKNSLRKRPYKRGGNRG
jgi:hypothetical protein